MLHALCNHLRGILPLNYRFAKLREPEKQKSYMARYKRSGNSKARFENSQR